MKQLYILATILILSINNLNAQSITISDNGGCFSNMILNIAGTFNGKNFYNNPGTGVSLYWDSTDNKWKTDAASATPGNNAFIIWFSSVNTPLNPPDLAYGSWTDDSGFCGALTQMEGSGTDNGSVLNITDENLKSSKLKIHPNPTSDFINITGKEENDTYNVYNSIGKKIFTGEFTINTPIDVKILKNGLYFLKFKSGAVIKFLKK